MTESQFSSMDLLNKKTALDLQTALLLYDYTKYNF